MSVYHGSPNKFTVAKPFLTSRSHSDKNGKIIVDYEGTSLHATPYKWIALSYSGNRPLFKHKGKRKLFGQGVNLIDKGNSFQTKTIIIFGKRSLNYSLEKIYGKGGYLYTFNKNKFKWVKGLGKNEVISFEEQVPLKIEFIKNPIKEMLKLGVKFKFCDLTKF